MQTRTAWVSLALALLLSGCGSISVWPFDDSKPSNVVGSRGPDNATEYRCDGGRSFYVRTLDGGKSVWLFLPDRQVRLDQVPAEAGSRYSNGVSVLRIDGSEVSLIDGPTLSYQNCKQPGSTAK